MRLRWLLIGCLIGPASANSDLWIHRSDLSSQLLAQAYLEPLSEAVGEEFVVLLANTAVDEAAEQVERLQGLIANASVMHPASDISPQVTLSMGIASCIPIREEDPWHLVEQADQGLYEAKKLGRNRYQVRAA